MMIQSIKNYSAGLGNEKKIKKIGLTIIFIFSFLGYAKYMTLIFILLFIEVLFFKKKRQVIFYDKWVIFLILLYTVNAMVSSYFSPYRTKAMLATLMWPIIYIPISYVRFSLNNKSDYFIKIILPLAIVISVVISLYMDIDFIRNFVINKIFVFKRYEFPPLDAATTPDYIIMLSGLGYGFIMQWGKKKSPWLGFIYLIFIFFSMALAFDRGGFVAFLIMSIFLLSYDWKRLIVFITLTVLFFIFIYKLQLLRGFEHLVDFLYSEATQEKLKSYAQINTFKTAIDIIKNNIWLGVGTSNFMRVSKHYGNGLWYLYAHNFILQFWAENGIFGLIIGLSILGLVFRRLLINIKYYRYKYIALGVGGSYIGMLIGNLSNSTIWLTRVALPFWMIVGVINSIYFIVCNDLKSNSI